MFGVADEMRVGRIRGVQRQAAFAEERFQRVFGAIGAEIAREDVVP